MSESTTGTPAAKGKSGKKILGLPRNVALVGGVAAVAGVAFFIYRERKDKAAAAAGTATSAETASGTVGTACTDPYGNPGTLDANGTCETVDESGSISALQTEIQGLESQPAPAAGATGPAGPAGPAGTGTTGPAGPAGMGAALPAPTNLKAAPGTSSVTLRWNTVAGGTNGYHYQVLSSSGANVHDASIGGGGAGVSGLKAKTAYKWRVAAHQTATRGASPWVSGPDFTTK
jgi:hypothetical protein